MTGRAVKVVGHRCADCGRYGVASFETFPQEDGTTAWRCTNREGCARRIEREATRAPLQRVPCAECGGGGGSIDRDCPACHGSGVAS